MPTAPANVPASGSSTEEEGRRLFLRGLHIGCFAFAAFVIEFFQFLFPGPIVEPTIRPYVGLLLIHLGGRFLLGVLGYLVLRNFGFQALNLVSDLLWRTSKAIPRQLWRESTWRSLRVWPCALGLGVVFLFGFLFLPVPLTYPSRRILFAGLAGLLCVWVVFIFLHGWFQLRKVALPVIDGQ
jgi:hypothetical protein